jgi:hypothetical protein
MKKRTWMAAALAAAVWFSAGAGSVARARAYTEVWTDLFEIVSVRTNVYGPVAFTGTEADSGIYVELEAKCNLPESVPTSGTTMEDGMQVFGGLHDTDFVLCRLAVDLGGYPGGGDRESPVYLRAEDCSYIANPTVPPYCSIFEDAAGEVDPLYTGTYLRIPVSELRKTDGRFSVCWYSHHTYPSSEYGEWVTQCLLDKKSCRFYLDAALMAEPYDNMWTVLKTASPADPQARGDCEVSEAVSLAPIAVPWPRWTGEEPSLAVSRREDGALEIAYTTVGNDVDTNSFPAAAGCKDFGHWVVAFVNVDSAGNRHVIPRDELQFTGDRTMEPLARTYALWDTEEVGGGTVVVTQNGQTGTDFFAPEAFALPTNPATFGMVWDNPSASGRIEAWVYCADMRPDANADRVFSDLVFQQIDSLVMPAASRDALLKQMEESSKALRLCPFPFGEYREAVSEDFLPALAGAVDFTASRGEYDDRVWLNWTPVDPASVASYDIVRFRDMGGVTGFEVLTNGMTSVGYLDTTVTPEVSYRYQLRIHDKWGRTWLSPFVNGWAFPRPDNDDFADARPISSKSGSDASTNNCASFQVSEPYPAGVATAGRTVWWDFTAPLDGIVQFNTAGSCELRHWGEEGEWTEDGILTALAVYTGKAVTVLDEVCSATPGESTWCSNAFEAASGTVYRIQVSGYGNYAYDEELQAWSEDWGRICLNWGYTHYRVTLDPDGGTISTNTVMVPVGQKLGEALRSFPVPVREGYRFVDWKFENNASVSASANYAIAQSHTLKAEWAWISSNDNFEDALPLDAPGQAGGSSEILNANATLQEGEPLLAAYPDATHTIWWSWTAPADGTARFSTTNSVDSNGSQIDTVIGIYTGSSLDSLEQVAKGDDGVGDSGFIDDIGTFWSFAEFEAEKGTTYYICVGVNDKYNRQAVEGTICLNWSLETDGKSHGNYALLPPGAGKPDISGALEGTLDGRLQELLGDSPETYNDFAEWANGKGGGDVRSSAHAAPSYLLGTSELLRNEPVITIEGMSLVPDQGGAAAGDGAKTVRPRDPDAPAALTLTVTVLDGSEPVEVTAAKVAALVEATRDACDWDSPEAKLDPHAEAITSGSGTTVTIAATPGDGAVPRAFLRVAP